MAKEVTIAREGTATPINSVRVSASANASARRIGRNNSDADRLERDGYTVERDKHPNGAYFAVIGDHHAHELEVGRIFAENGFAFTLDREGKAMIKINGRRYTLPSPDGRVEGFTHEIYALNSRPNSQRVVDAITHSHKPFRYDERKSVQSDIAISITPKGSKYTRHDLADGVVEYKRQVSKNETKARPLLYLHVDESTRKIYRWDIK